MVLHDVAQRAGAVVERGTPLQCERLLPQQVRLRDALVAPLDRFAGHGVPGGTQVLHSGHGQGVVDAVDSIDVAARQCGQRGVQLDCAAGIVTERLLDRDPAAGRQRWQGTHGVGHQLGGQGQIHRHRTGCALGRDVQHCGDIGGVGDVCLLVVQKVGERGGHPFLRGRPDQAELRSEPAVRPQRRHGRQQQPTGEVTRRTEDHQRVDHRCQCPRALGRLRRHGDQSFSTSKSQDATMRLPPAVQRNKPSPVGMTVRSENVTVFPGLSCAGGVALPGARRVA